MQKSAKEILNEIQQLNQMIRDRETELRDAIRNIIETSAKSQKPNPSVKKLGKKCYTINVSALFNNPWSIDVFVWEECVDAIYEHLCKKPAYEWKSELEALLKTSGKEPYIRMKNGTQTKVDRNFIIAIIESL